MSARPLKDQFRAVRRRSLPSRVRRLEAEIQENRQLNRRIAELTDLVVELLIPLETRDHDEVDRLLTAFRAGL